MTTTVATLSITALPTALATVQVPTRPPETTMTSPNTNLDLNFILQQDLANQILNGHAYVEP